MTAEPITEHERNCQKRADKTGDNSARGAEKNFANRRGHQWGTAASPVTVHALDLALPIREVDCPYRARPDGSTSKPSTYRDGTRIALTLIYLYEQVRPALFFGLVGGMMAVLSLGLGIPVVLEFLPTGLVPRLPTAVLTSTLMLLAVLTGACGVILDSVGCGRKEAKRLVLGCGVHLRVISRLTLLRTVSVAATPTANTTPPMPLEEAQACSTSQETPQ